MCGTGDQGPGPGPGPGTGTGTRSKSKVPPFDFSAISDFFRGNAKKTFEIDDFRSF